MITKSDFRLFLDSPRHLWAKRQQQWQAVENVFEQKLAAEGYEVEKQARDFLQQQAQKDKHLVYTQKELIDGEFLAKIDILIYKPASDSYDVYEVKSSAYEREKDKLNKIDLYDITFQTLIAEKHFKIDHNYLLLLNADYVRKGEIDWAELLIKVEVSEEIAKLKAEVEEKREQAVAVAKAEDCGAWPACYNPKKCGCLSVCHPNLPEHHIYQVFYQSRSLLKKLRQAGIIDLFGVSAKIAMSDKQAKQMLIYRSQERLIEVNLIKNELSKYEWPLYFLDYETNASAIPEFDGHLPHQNQVVQYSLHIIEAGGQIRHEEFVYQGEADPMRATLEHLSERIGEQGTILVWNEAFEKSVNEKAALSYPDLAGQLQAINDRIRDLANSFKNQWYLDRKFHGSWSIKNVLPVLCPDLSYQDLEIGKGDVAMMQWRKMNEVKTSEQEREKIKQDLLAYCQLDTWAMVRIWQELVKLGGS